MNQIRLEKAVARATGESLREIRHRGFSVAEPGDSQLEQESWERQPLVVNWDQVDAQRVSIFP